MVALHWQSDVCLRNRCLCCVAVDSVASCCSVTLQPQDTSTGNLSNQTSLGIEPYLFDFDFELVACLSAAVC